MSEEVSSTFSFDSEVIERALRNIYSKEFNAMTDIEQNLFAEFWAKLCEATDIGIAKSNTSYITGDFYHELQYNNAVFAAFKTHRMGNDMAKLLHDSNGNLKPFEQWLNAVRPIADHQVYNWFKTEYSTAIGRAHLAADWKQFEAEKDVLPNLEWMSSTSVEPRLSHIQYYGLILPIDHPFWKKHRPRDEWGCKCDLEATDVERTPESQTPSVDGSVPSKGLDNNPADDGKLFSDSHPYFTNAYSGAQQNIATFMQNQISARIKVLRQEAKILTQQSFANSAVSNTITISNRGIKEWLNQPHRDRYVKNELLLSLDELIKNSVYRGFGADKHDSKIVAHLFEVEINGGKSWIIGREMKGGQIQIHSISDSENILRIANKKPTE